ncbi:Uncharacterized protein APZ42_031436 [Daphnia magna]|uniref:RNA-directed DNA polymerase n=1 Tax=Daphnia magna TaxID=35525 RepID=A0A164MW04_9CRUS|nr:Uncharacterized protein APZ42_031436 [Daphnia magna]
MPFGANLKLKMEKCGIGNQRVRMLGHVVSKAGIKPDPEHCKAIEMFPGPNLNANEKAKRKLVKSFVGLCSFYRKFFPNFAQVVNPLTVMEGKGVFRWGEPERNGFAELKAALVKAAQLALPDYSKNFEVHPDPCDYGIGAALMQERNGHPMPICFVSRVLNKSERNYTITEEECLAIVWAVKKIRPYILGTKIVVKTDHHALCWLMTKKELSGRLERWSLSLQEYDISIQYKKGSLHEDADALSHYPIQERGLDTRSWSDGQDRVRQWRWIKQVMIKNGSTQNGNFMLKEDLLYLRTIRFGQEFDRLCVPPKSRKEALSWVHDEPTAKHLWQTKTLERARNRFFWPKIDRAVTPYVQSCKSCHTRKPDQGKKKGLMEITQEGKPFERIGIDVLGPFPRSRNGNTNIVVAVDYLTKWVEAMALPDATTRQIAKFFVEDLVVRHGFPREFTSDQGKEAVIPADLLAATGPSKPKLVGAEDLMKAMMELREDVKDRLAMVQQRQKTQCDARVSAAPVYEPGDLVLIFRPQRKKGLAEKLLHQYVGPYKVIRQVTELNYELRKLVEKTFVVHVSQMKNAEFGSTGLAPRLGTDTSIARRKWLESVPGGQGGGGTGERQRSFVHSSVATSKEESVSHSYAELAPYLGVSPDRQLFVEFNVDEVRKCAPYTGSVCPFLKPIDRKGRMKSYTAAVFLQEQEGIQRNCHLDSKKWTGIDLFYIGGRKWGYVGKGNVTIMLQCTGKRIGGIDLPQVLPAAGVIKIPRLCSATSDEWVLQASFRQMMPVDVTSVIDEEAAGMLSGLLAPVVEQSQPGERVPSWRKHQPP